MSRTSERPDDPGRQRPPRKPHKKRDSSTKIFRGGFEYTRAWSSRLKMVFRCSVYRSTGCKARLEIRPTASGYHLVNDHTCVQASEGATEIVDGTFAMKNRVDSLSVLNLTAPISEVWKQVCAEFYVNDDVIRKGLSEEQVKRRVYRVRQEHYGAFLLGRIEVPPLSMVEGKNLSFFQFHMSRPKDDPTAKPDRIIGWAHPELRQLLMYNGVSLFFDGTFRCVPTEFKQCMVLMVHDQASELFVPVYFVLCSSKAKDVYFDILELIYRDTSEKLQPCDVVCDFELPLINAVEKQFPNAEIIGCLFHFKQAVRWRMKTTYCITKAEIKIAMTQGVLDMLTVIEPELVPRQGIRWVKRTIRAHCIAQGVPYSRQKWKRFWGYFRATWLGRYNVESWNVHGLENSLVARTNNALERFHRELNRAFPTPHPNIATFVSVIRAISQDYSSKLTNVAQGRPKRGNKRNAKKRKEVSRRSCGNGDEGTASIGLPTPVAFTDLDAATDSESEVDMPECEITSDSECEGDGERESDTEAVPDFSFEPGEYCDDEYHETVV